MKKKWQPNAKKVMKGLEAKKAAGTTAMYTFRFSPELMDRFKTQCEKRGHTMTEVLRAFIEDVVKTG